MTRIQWQGAILRRFLVVAASTSVAVLCVTALYFRSLAAQSVARIDSILLTGGHVLDWEPQLHRVVWWFPNNNQAWLQMGFFLAKEERFAEAAAALEHVTPQSEYHREASYARGKALLSDGQYEAGEKVLREHVSSYSRSIEGWNLLYLLLAEQLRQGELISDLKIVVVEDPTNLQLLLFHFRAIADFPQAQKYESRLQAVNAAHSRQPGVVAALGKVAWLKGEREQAARFFNELLELAPLRPQAILWAAEFFLDTRAFIKAEATLSLIASLEDLGASDRAKYWLVRSRLSLSKKLHETALDEVDQAIRIQAHFATAHAHRASVLRYLMRVAEAAEAGASAAQCGAIDEELNRLSSSIVQAPPSQAMARRIGEILREIGHSEVADAWVRVERSMVAQ